MIAKKEIKAEKMSLKFPKLKAANCIVAFLSSALQAFGMYNIHALSGVTEGGVLGATLLFDHWFGLSPAVSSFVLNIACYALGWKTLGKSFIAYSAIAACGYSASYAVCELFPPLWPEIASLPLLASVAGALFIGVGAGLCVRAFMVAEELGIKSSSLVTIAGAVTLAMSLSHLTKIPIQWIYLTSDLIVLGLSLTYIPVRRIGYSLLTVILSGQLIGLMQRIRLRPEPKRAA